jgi:hypothetical protein
MTRENDGGNFFSLKARDVQIPATWQNKETRILTLKRVESLSQSACHMPTEQHPRTECLVFEDLLSTDLNVSQITGIIGWCLDPIRV